MSTIDYKTWDEYREAIRQFCVYPDALERSDLEMCYLVLGLSSEVGEVSSLLKKAIRDDTDYDEEAVYKWKGEMSDVLWYFTRICDTLDFSLEELMDHNYKKLASRKQRGVIGGSGDDR